MKITVVTVCYNAESVIKATIESVLSQDYENIEYIIKDGASKDSTREIISSYLDDSRIIYASEPDTGLYNAMNIATRMSSGEYIIFMNAGDIFYSSHSISDVFSNLNEYPDIIYGDTIRQLKDSEFTESYKSTSILKLLLCGRIMCHQSMFIKSDIMKEFLYDESYTITADFDFVTRAYASKKRFLYIEKIISKVESVEGISFRDSNLTTMRKQDDMSLKKNLAFWYYLILIPKNIYRFFHHN